MQIKVVPINELKGFNLDEFNLSEYPYPDIMLYKLDAQVQMQALELAKTVNNICFVIVETDEGPKVVTQSLNKGMSSALVLYNAKEVDENTNCEKVHAITFNTGRGALTRYWTDKYLAYEKGKVWYK